MMGCPNGHKGGMFCCEDQFNQVVAATLKRMETYEPAPPIFYVTLDQLKWLEKKGPELQSEATE